MRNSICAQSWDSVPPAPALISTIALSRSCGPLSIFDSSSLSAPWIASETAALASTRVASSFASSASSWSATASSSRWRSRSYSAICSMRSLFSLLSAWARFWSSQNPGCTLSRSISSTRARFRSMSKRPPKRIESLGELVQVRWKGRHVLPLSRNGGFRQGNAHHALFSQETPLGRCHLSRLARVRMIVSAAMQDPVRQQPARLGRPRASPFPRLSPRRLQRDDHVAQGAGVIQGEREHVGGAVLSAPAPVEAANLAIGDQRDGKLLSHPTMRGGAEDRGCVPSAAGLHRHLHPVRSGPTGWHAVLAPWLGSGGVGRGSRGWTPRQSAGLEKKQAGERPLPFARCNR